MFSVYTIYDKSTGEDVYIGSTMNPERRWAQHKNDRFPSTIYGFLVIDQCESREEMLKREIELIQQYHPQYNVAHRIAGVSFKKEKPVEPIPEEKNGSLGSSR